MNVRIFIIGAVIACVMPLHTIAQVLVSGKVIDVKTNNPLTGARVVAADRSAGAMTDVDGNFLLKVAKLPVEVVAYYIGYDSLRITLSQAKGETIALSEAVITTETVEIVANAAEERQKQSPLSVESMSITAIKETPAANFYEGLGQLKGVDLTSASIGFRIVNTRGFNSTSPVRSLQIIDGVDNQAPGLNFSLGNFLGAPDLDVESVDLVVGASSAFFGPNAFNGVISMKTKNPFIHQGISVSAKTGERNLMEIAVRYAHAFKINGAERLAFKLNFFGLRADDWQATNYDPVYGTDTTKEGRSNPGGYDAVNRYGDENLVGGRNYQDDALSRQNWPGLGIFHRPGYEEKDLVNYNTRNIKSSAALHYKIRPEVELIAASSFGTGTTVYQGDNRYSLKDILFFQHRLEVRKENKFFLRAYTTNENAGNSYDAVFTAFRIQELAKRDIDYNIDYQKYWEQQIKPRVQKLKSNEGEAFPTPQVIFNPDGTISVSYDDALATRIMQQHRDSLVRWHQMSNTQAGYYPAGSDQFNAAKADVIAKPLGQGGTRLIDRSKLFHVHGEYKWNLNFADVVTGANGRLYTPISDGTIFSDSISKSTGKRYTITNHEFGAYVGAEKRVYAERLKLNATVRLDKNQNFNYVVSPAASAVYKVNEHDVLRLSFSSALRNPTLADQYLHYNVGRAILKGNLSGFDSLVTVQSFIDYLNADPNSANNFKGFKYFNVAPIRPEQVRTFEIGYRTTLNRLYVDAGYYYSYYTHFIGYNLGLEVYRNNFGGVSGVQAYRVAANATSAVTTQGFSLGLNYFFENGVAFNGNYSWNRLNKQGTDDPIIPAFNTPEHKFNVGFSARDRKYFGVEKIGWNVNYKWVQGFMFEGSPQFTGFVPSYDMFDAQINKTSEKLNCNFKLGVSNLFGIMPLLNTDGSFGDKLSAAFDNRQFQVYGGPRIGRMTYFAVTFNLERDQAKK